MRRLSCRHITPRAIILLSVFATIAIDMPAAYDAVISRRYADAFARQPLMRLPCRLFAAMVTSAATSTPLITPPCLRCPLPCYYSQRGGCFSPFSASPRHAVSCRAVRYFFRHVAASRFTRCRCCLRQYAPAMPLFTISARCYAFLPPVTLHVTLFARFKY